MYDYVVRFLETKITADIKSISFAGENREG